VILGIKAAQTGVNTGPGPVCSLWFQMCVAVVGKDFRSGYQFSISAGLSKRPRPRLAGAFLEHQSIIIAMLVCY